MNRRFPPPWTVEEANNACFIVKDANGFAVSYVYFEDEPDGASPPIPATLLSCNVKVRRIWPNNDQRTRSFWSASACNFRLNVQ
jgi:hypothetical protein